jgi:hypothetical protein
MKYSRSIHYVFVNFAKLTWTDFFYPLAHCVVVIIAISEPNYNCIWIPIEAKSSIWQSQQVCNHYFLSTISVWADQICLDYHIIQLKLELKDKRRNRSIMWHTRSGRSSRSSRSKRSSRSSRSWRSTRSRRRRRRSRSSGWGPMRDGLKCADKLIEHTHDLI